MGDFQQVVWDYYRRHGRSMPWRTDPSFYNVLVSEVMLQQTQVARVLVKYDAFIWQFATMEQLAAASLSDVIVAWQGLGYNRRAKYLHEAAQWIVAHGQPTDSLTLTQLPGIGKNTAAAMMNYVYNRATPFIETNIRTVYLYHFFRDAELVADSDLLPIITKTMDNETPREWFWALMDYGSHLKSMGVTSHVSSKHYKKQATFAGSVRQTRGDIIRALQNDALPLNTLRKLVEADARFEVALRGLLKDGLITQNRNYYHLTK